jgi:hypothetical protein
MFGWVSEVNVYCTSFLVCVQLRTHTRAHTRSHTHTHTMYACMQVRTLRATMTPRQAHTHARTHTHTHTHVCVYTHAFRYELFEQLRPHVNPKATHMLVPFNVLLGVCASHAQLRPVYICICIFTYILRPN